MNTPSSPVFLWESGRLAERPAPRALAFTREQWIAATLLVLAAVVFAVFVAVVERAVQRSEIQHRSLRARAVAEAECEAAKPAESRGDCRSLFDGQAQAGAAAAAGAEAGRQAAGPSWHVSTAAVAATAGARE